jgi:hypothetical protein
MTHETQIGKPLGQQFRIVRAVRTVARDAVIDHGRMNGLDILLLREIAVADRAQRGSLGRQRERVRIVARVALRGLERIMEIFLLHDLLHVIVALETWGVSGSAPPIEA